MCGIFGYITTVGDGPSVERLRKIAIVTQSRGMHAFGLAWLNRDGSVGQWKAEGPAENHLGQLDAVADARIVIGHCRYATHGSPANPNNNHPHPAGGGVIVHNGIVFNHEQLVVQYGLQPRSECDSEVIGLMMANASRGTILRRAAYATSRLSGDLAILGLWRKPGRLLVARRGRPLMFGQSKQGYYFASLAEGLPGPRPVADRLVYMFQNIDGRLTIDSTQISDPDFDPFELDIDEPTLFV